MRLRKSTFDNIILRLPMRSDEDAATIERIHKCRPDVPILVLSDSTDTRMRDVAIRRGAKEYFTKTEHVWEDILRCIRHVSQEQEIFRNLLNDYCYRKSLIADAPNPIVCASPEGIVMEFNVEAELLWNRDRHEVVGRHLRELFVDDARREEFMRHFRQTVEGRLSRNCAGTIALDDDEPQSMLWDMSRTADGQGRTTAVIMIGHEPAGSAAENYVEEHPDFEDTAYMVLAALEAVMVRIDQLEAADPDILRLLDDDAESRTPEPLREEQASAVERLVLSLIGQARRGQ